jgi:hypothetical protein
MFEHKAEGICECMVCSTLGLGGINPRCKRTTCPCRGLRAELEALMVQHFKDYEDTLKGLMARAKNGEPITPSHIEDLERKIEKAGTGFQADATAAMNRAMDRAEGRTSAPSESLLSMLFGDPKRAPDPKSN